MLRVLGRQSIQFLTPRRSKVAASFWHRLRRSRVARSSVATIRYPITYAEHIKERLNIVSLYEPLFL